MILDTFTKLYVWIGADSNEEEKRMALQTARAYLEQATDRHDDSCDIVVVTAGAGGALCLDDDAFGWFAHHVVVAISPNFFSFSVVVLLPTPPPLLQRRAANLWDLLPRMGPDGVDRWTPRLKVFARTQQRCRNIKEERARKRLKYHKGGEHF